MYLKYLFAITLLQFTLLTAGAQSNLSKAVSYFRVDPFRGNFSAFVNALVSDTALLEKQMLKQTDTTGFYLRGRYEVFNPFSMNANRVDMIFYESNNYKQSGFWANYFTYQLTALFPDNPRSRDIVKKDFKKLLKTLRRSLPYVRTIDLGGKQGIEEGKIANLSDNDAQVDPVLISWQTMTQSDQLGLTVILRIKRVGNEIFPVNAPIWW